MDLPIKILLIDDDPAMRQLTGITLRRHISGADLTVAEAASGIEALSLLRSAQHMPDIILLDIHMPGMDGLEFLEALGREAISRVPLVYILSTAAAELPPAALTSPFLAGAFEKPLLFEHIDHIIATHTSRPHF